MIWVSAIAERLILGKMAARTMKRPERLNALTPAMVDILTAALDTWERDDAVAAVLLDGAGARGLCAGGDLHMLCADRGGTASAAFLAAEYRLDLRTARHPKPYVAFMDGLVMGGGVGLSAHGGVRVVTERTVRAMPEVGIGNVPGADAIVCGVRRRAPPRGTRRSSTGSRWTRGPRRSPAERSWIDACCGGDDAVAIVDRLRADGLTAAADAIESASPVAVVLTPAALRAARGGTLERAPEREYALLPSCLRWPDFARASARS